MFFIFWLEKKSSFLFYNLSNFVISYVLYEYYFPVTLKKSVI